jgi:DNA-binding GntR family transcriptional regulator
MRGAFVSTMSELELRGNFGLISGLEAFSGELACERITKQEIAEIRSLHFSMLARCARADLAGFYEGNQAIRDRINEASRNQALRSEDIGLNRRLQAERFRSNFQADKWDRAIDNHSTILSAPESRDGKRLSSVLRQNLLEKRDAVLQELQNDSKLKV